MSLRLLLPLLGLVLGLGALAAAPAPDTAEKPDAAAITRLVARLGTGDYDDRIKASAALEAIGEPALAALRDAVNSAEGQVRERIEALVGRIEKRLEAEIIRTPRRVHLHFKDTPVKDAFEAFRKESGYDLALDVPDDKLKDRTVTLDIDNAPFWQAFASFCDKAGLREAEVQDLVSVRPPYSNSPAGPLIAIDRITLIDGKAAGGPTEAASVVRIHALNQPKAPAAGDDLPIPILFSLEPRLLWLSIDEVTIAKAVDDQKQELHETGIDRKPPNPAAMPPVIWVGDKDFIGGGIHREVVFHLKKGPKAAGSLMEFRGTVTAKILGPMSAIISAPNILNASGKTFLGGEDGQIKVLDVSKEEDGKITIRLQMHPPSGVVPADGIGVPAGVAKEVYEAVCPAGRRGGGPFGCGTPNDNGLGLMDDQGNNVKVAPGGLLEVRGEKTPFGVVNRITHTFAFQAAKGQRADKLVLCGRKILTVEIPFTLKDVPLP
jgi:hypothetical protein